MQESHLTNIPGRDVTGRRELTQINWNFERSKKLGLVFICEADATHLLGEKWTDKICRDRR